MNGKYIKFNGRSRRVNNGKFWSKYTVADHEKTMTQCSGIKLFPTIHYMGQNCRVYNHSVNSRGSYNIMQASREWENVFDVSTDWRSRDWSGSYFYSKYTAEDHERYLAQNEKYFDQNN